MFLGLEQTVLLNDHSPQLMSRFEANQIDISHKCFTPTIEYPRTEWVFK